MRTYTYFWNSAESVEPTEHIVSLSLLPHAHFNTICERGNYIN